MKKAAILLLFLVSSFVKAQQWSQVGLGSDGAIYCFYNDTSTGLLWIGGSFQNIDGVYSPGVAVYDGYAISPMNGPTSGKVLSITKYRGDIYIAGNFNVPSSPFNKIAKWNGTTWQSLGIGVVGTQINSLCVYNDELYVAGDFISAGGNPMYSIGSWDGLQWKDVGGVFTNIVGTLTQGIVSTMYVFNGELYVGGDLYYAGQGVNAIYSPYLVKRKDTSWSSLSSLNVGYFPETMIAYNSKLFVGGTFISPMNRLFGIDSFGLSSNVSWCPIPPSICPGFFMPLTSSTFNNELYIGGSYWNTGSLIADNVRSYLGGNSWTIVDSAFNSEVFALVGYNNSLYAGGLFLQSGLTDILHFARLTIDSLVLPIELSNFVCSLRNEKPLLTWQTLSESNTNRFDIERSFDGSNFEIVGKVLTGGTSVVPKEYDWIDSSNVLGFEDMYYRLKQVDNDGKYTYSDICQVDLNYLNQKVNVFPNPFSSRLTFAQATDGIVYNILGQPVYNFRNEVSIDTEPWPSGLYLLVFRTGVRQQLVKY